MLWNSKSTNSMRWLSVIVVVSVFLLQNSSVSAQHRECTTTEAQRADSEADTLKSWETLYKSYKRYGHCDDGAIAEGYSESVARILVDHWNTLSQLAPHANKDAKFLRFVLSHVNATLDANDLEKIKANATKRCPLGLKATCVQLRRHAESALKEQASPQ